MMMSSPSSTRLAASPLRTIVVDDESSGREALKVMIGTHCPEIRVVDEAPSMHEAFKKIDDVDLVFLDIELPDGSGFDFLDGVGPRNFEVIFVTAYDHYGIQAVKAAAADYLLKPVGIEELREAVQRVALRCIERRAARIADMQPADEMPVRLALPNADGLVIVEVADVVRCQSHSNYTEFHIADGRSILVSRSMGEYEKVLVHSGFFRIHNSHIINMRYVRSYIRGKGGYVVMADGSHVDVSVRRKEAFLKMLSQ